MQPDQFEQTKYLTGLRAYAAMAVFFVHCGGFGLINLGGFFEKIVSHGKYGVIVFFILSSYTLALSISRETSFSWNNYLVKRTFRILPPYYIAIALMFVLGGSSYYLSYFDVENDWWNLFLHISFFNLIEIRYLNSILGVEWSIPIEFLSYIYFPIVFFLFKLRSIFFCLFFLGASFIFVHLVWGQILGYFYFNHQDLAFHWSLVRYFPIFTLGIVTFFLSQKIEVPLNQKGTITAFCLICLFVVIYFNSRILEQLLPMGGNLFNETIAVWFSIFLLTLKNRNRVVRTLFENKIVIFYGNRSYSFYLCHLPILIYLETFKMGYFQTGFIGFLIATIISHLTYKYIEMPSIAWGKFLITRHR